jgi:hypothetical protein
MDNHQDKNAAWLPCRSTVARFDCAFNGGKPHNEFTLSQPLPCLQPESAFAPWRKTCQYFSVRDFV